MEEQIEFLERAIRDSVAQKRVVKWGFVRQFGGLYPDQCDSVAAHGCAVATLATFLASELGPELEDVADVSVNLEKVALMAVFHDFGEGRSGDTGALSYSTRGFCNLHFLEEEGLKRSLRGSRLEERVTNLFKEYRAYSSPEAIVVHVADNLEGFEKALHSARGTREILADTQRISNYNINIYQDRASKEDSTGKTAAFFLEKALLPGFGIIARAYDCALRVQEDYSIQLSHVTGSADSESIQGIYCKKQTVKTGVDA